jgi:hypothetical protein
VLAEPIPAEGFLLEGNPVVAVETGHTDTDKTSVLHVPSIGRAPSSLATRTRTGPMIRLSWTKPGTISRM